MASREGRSSAARHAFLALLPLVLLARPEIASSEIRDPTLTLYVAQVSGESGWEDVMINPVFGEYVDSFLAVAALSGTYGRYRNGRLQLEAEGQVAYNFGQQHHWEFNAVPVIARWNFLPWHAYQTSAAFGIGLSYASDVPEVEVELEGESHNLMVYWVAELTAGPYDAPWSLSLRLHHRSVAYGLFGEDGGMNGVGLGLRYRF